MAIQIPIQCKAIKATLDDLKSELEALQNELHGGAGVDGITRPKAVINQDILAKRKEIRPIQTKLDECIRANPLPPPATFPPKHILETNFKNPKFDTSDPDWAAKFAGGGTAPFGTFPLGSPFEWKQVLSPDEDYDYDKVGASGWVLQPDTAKKDFPFFHPFGNDWKFELALDNEYKALSAESNGTVDIGSVGIISKLGVEMDKKLVPKSFRDLVKQSHRAVIFGRWVIDCGHDNFRAEIHPPLLMAIARPMDPDTQNLRGSKAIFTSRPYLVSQKFTTDTDTIYNDEAEDSGFFRGHMLNEIAKVVALLSLTLKAHPKIKSKPFQGILLASVIVRPTSLKPKLPPFRANPYKLAVSFNFTIRTGCAVQIKQIAGDAVQVTVVLNAANYIAPPLPTREDKKLNSDEIKEASGSVWAGVAYFVTPNLLPLIFPTILNPSSLVNFAQAVHRGIETDKYDAPLQVKVDHRKNQVNNVLASDIPNGAGITVDNTQPYPFYGWVEVKWVDTSQIIHQ